MTHVSVTWHAAMRPMPGETICGDGYRVATSQISTLIVGIDGLGHGVKAAEATQATLEAIDAQPQLGPLDLLEHCHRAIRHTRGAAMTAARINHQANEIVWAGVGNVNALILRYQGHGSSNREHLLLRGGVVGYRLPSLRAHSTRIRPCDTLIMVSDGIRSGFAEALPSHQNPEDIAQYILSNFARETDDATAIVVRLEDNHHAQ